MTTKGRPGGPPVPRDRKRPAPTIDLTATEVASEPVKPPEPTQPVESAPPVQPEVPPQEPERAAQVQMSDAPRTDTPQPSPSAEAPPPRPRPAIAWLPPDFPWPLVAAGAGGVLLTLAVLAAAGVFSTRDGGIGAAEARLARVEERLRELAARPAPLAADPKAVDDLAARVGRLETIAATPKPPVTDAALANRLAMLEGELRALGERVGVLARRSDEIASIAGAARKEADAATAAVIELRKAQPPAGSVARRKEVEALSTRVAALERTAKAIEAQLGQRVGADAGADRALRALVVAGALTAAVERGAPYVAELAAATAAAPDPKVLAPLERFAQSGVPTADALARELTLLIPELAKAIGTRPRNGGILDRLKANAEKIVRVRPIEDVAGDDPAAVIQRIEARAAGNNLAGALAELAKLPASARAAAKDWIARAEARDAAIAASRRFASAALAALGKPSL